MKKNAIEIIATSVLAVILLFAVFNAAGSRRRFAAKTRDIRAVSQAAQTHGAPPDAPLLTLKELEEEAKKLKWDKDPFVYRPVYLVGGTGDLVLSGIAWDRESPRAMINGMILGVGDKVGGYTVVDITKDSVILTDGAKEIKLKL